MIVLRIRTVLSSGMKDGAHKYIVTGVQKNSGQKLCAFRQRALTGKVKPMTITKKQRSEQRTKIAAKVTSVKTWQLVPLLTKEKAVIK